MKMVISKYSVKYIPVKPCAITNALSIYGTDLSGVRRKKVRNKPPRVETGMKQISNDFHWLHHFFTLNDDVMFVNGVALLTTISSKIRLVTDEHIPDQTNKQPGNSLTMVINMYARGVFLVNIILMDQ